MLNVFYLLFVGILAGCCGSIAGLGGGFIAVPAMTFLFPGMVPAHLAGTSMAMLWFISLSGTFAYARQKRIDYASAGWFAASMIPGSILGAVTSEMIRGKIFFEAFGVFLIGISLLLLFKPKQPFRFSPAATVKRKFTDITGQSFEYAYHRPTGVIISFAVGYISSLFGIGGGSVMVPTMTLLLFFPPHIAIATSMFNIFISSTVGLGTHWVLGNIDWTKVMFLAPGAIIGGQIGARLAKRLPAKMILRILALLLCIAAVRIILK